MIMDSCENTNYSEQDNNIQREENQIMQTTNTKTKSIVIVIISIITVLIVIAVIVGIRFYSGYIDDKKAADNVISLINTITDSDDELAWSEPRKAYDALTDKQKNMVSNLSILENAEKEYNHNQDLLFVGMDISLLYTYMLTATDNYLAGNSSYILLMEKASDTSKKLDSRNIPDELKDVYELCMDTYTNFGMMIAVQNESKKEYATKFAQDMLLLKKEVNKINDVEYLENKEK